MWWTRILESTSGNLRPFWRRSRATVCRNPPERVHSCGPFSLSFSHALVCSWDSTQYPLATAKIFARVRVLTLLCHRHRIRRQRSDFLSNFLWADGSNLELGHRPFLALSVSFVHTFFSVEHGYRPPRYSRIITRIISRSWARLRPSSLILCYHDLGHLPFSLCLISLFASWSSAIVCSGSISIVARLSLRSYRLLFFCSVCIIICSAHCGRQPLFLFRFSVFHSFAAQWSSVFSFLARLVSCFFVLSFHFCMC